MDSLLPVNKELNLDQLIKSRVDYLSEASKTDDNGKLTDKKRTEYEKAARGFESMLVHTLYKGMKDAMLDEDKEEEGDSFGADTLEGYTDLMFSDYVSKSGSGIGIAEKIYEQLTGGEKLKHMTVEIPAKPIPPEMQIQIKPPVINHLPEQKVSTTFLDRVSGRLDSYNEIIEKASDKYNIPSSLIKSVITTESAGRNEAKSGVGAKGLMQLMDSTAKDLGVKNSFDPYQNIMGGTRYLRELLDKYNGSLELALAAYNAGPGNIDKYNGIPPFNETKNYVSKVIKYNRLFEDI